MGLWSKVAGPGLRANGCTLVLCIQYIQLASRPGHLYIRLAFRSGQWAKGRSCAILGNMNGIFINGNRPPRPKHRGLILGLIACLALGQLLLYVLFLGPAFFPPRPEETRAEVPTIVNSRPLPTSPPARTLRSAAEGPILDAFFGPLPVLEGEPRKISHDKPLRGIYLGMGENLEAALELASWSELNAVVVDVKESWGLCYESAVPLAVEMKASSGQLELKSLIDRCHAAGLTFIARMVCFKDEVMTRMQPDLCIRDAEGKVLHYPLEGGEAFANPYNTEVWDYLLDLSREVIAMGADEIQFDYVRFPTGQPEGGATPLYREESDVRTKPEESDPQDQREPLEVPEKEAAINRFLETARIELQDKLGVPVSADLFSIVMSSPEDGRLIGQNWSRIGLSGIHCLSPMIYPSHYANASAGSLGNGKGSSIGSKFFDAPDLSPYDVVTAALEDGAAAAGKSGYAGLRPWLQAFTANWLAPGYYMDYGPREIRAQIQALYDAGYDEWLLWNAGHEYPESLFLSREEAEAELRKNRAVRESKPTLNNEEESLRQALEGFPIATGSPTKSEP